MLKQKTLYPVTNFLAACQNQIAWFQGFYELAPSKAAWQSFPHFLALNFVGLEVDAIFQGL